MKIEYSLSKNFFNTLAASRLAIPMLLACLVGTGTSLIGVGFIHIIALVQNVFFDKGSRLFGFLGQYVVIFIPAVGGLCVGPLVTYFAPEAKGHGVPEVLKAMVLRGGKIRPVVVVVKAIASAIAIGTGASVGREGPIVQVGSAFGSTTAQMLRLSETRVKNLVACGAAAGIACVFNAPIAGVMFALEVILRDFGARSLGTVVVAAVSSSIVSRVFLGESPAFTAPVYSLKSPFEMSLYLGLGVLSALIAHLFMFALHESESLFERWRFPEWLKPAIGGLAVGCVGLYFPQIFGSGLEPIGNALHGNFGLGLLVALIFLKIIATSVSLGSGSSGGVFAPALFIGSMLGGTVGTLASNKVPFPTASPGAYAIVGMASVFAAAAHAPVTAILIVFEMTRDYRMILPIMASVVIATSISQLISRESIYTMKLKERGIDIGHLDEVRVLGALQVRDAMSAQFEAIPNTMDVKSLIEKVSLGKDKTFFVTNPKGDVMGEIKTEDMQTVMLEENMKGILAADIAAPILEYCLADEPLSHAAKLMVEENLTRLPVMDLVQPKRVVGILKTEDIFRIYSDLTVRRADLTARSERETSQASDTIPASFVISARSSIVGKAIKDLELPDGVFFQSIRRGRKSIIPRGNTALAARDKVWAILNRESKPSFEDWLKHQKIQKSYFH